MLVAAQSIRAGAYAANPGRGLCGPCTPHQGHWPWTHFATNNMIEQVYLRMKREETKRNSTTGTMKTKKKAGQES